MNKIIFAGTPEIAAGVLNVLVNKHFNVIACLTQPDRAQGRGLKVTPSPVKVLARQSNIPVLQPDNLKDPAIVDQIAQLQPDLILVLAYGIILPSNLLSIPKFGCVNIHASILPRWRGAAPIQHAILAGDTESGITIMQMDVGMDTGDILAVYPCPVLKTDTSAVLHDRLAKLAQTSCIDSLPKIFNGELSRKKQNHDQATYANKISKNDARIDWHQPAVLIDRMVRAYNPWPVAYTNWENETIRIWRTQVDNSQTFTAPPGTVIGLDHQGTHVATGDGVLTILELQFPGKKITPASLAQLPNGAIFT